MNRLESGQVKHRTLTWRFGWLAGLTVLTFAGMASQGVADDPWLVIAGGPDKPGSGKQVVLISGDEEYRSEEALPQLAKILAKHHGFDCTVLFAIDPKTGEIDPENINNIPGLDALATADLMIIATRWRNLADEQMQQIVDYIEAGKPVLGMRTATHAFKIPTGAKFSKYSSDNESADYDGGFGRQVLGETWIAHHGKHKKESTRGIVVDPDHPIMRGIEDGAIWGTTDVYRVRLPLTGDAHTLVRGAVLTGMEPDDEPVSDDRNDPMMPIAWTRTYNDGRVFTTTMGASTDLENEAVRRMLVNAAYWCVGLEDKIEPDADVSIVGEFKPSKYGFGDHVPGKRPADYK